MIKYQLKCKTCNSIFDSWFASSKEFEKLKKMNLINCETCNSFKIDKSVMSPRISSNLNSSKEKNTAKVNEVKSKIKEFQSFVKKNFEYVGENFSYEARSIHYGNKKSKKGIYGNASSKDIKELNDEGIETTTVPWINDKEN
jgi:Uncharacterized protein conserved in bacteria|tara:strand:- start:728 stop:1153 length:426 start_codon:yes stop_codon:yes gene_type:complete